MRVFLVSFLAKSGQMCSPRPDDPGRWKPPMSTQTRNVMNEPNEVRKSPKIFVINKFWKICKYAEIFSWYFFTLYFLQGWESQLLSQTGGPHQPQPFSAIFRICEGPVFSISSKNSILQLWKPLYIPEHIIVTKSNKVIFDLNKGILLKWNLVS